MLVLVLVAAAASLPGAARAAAPAYLTQWGSPGSANGQFNDPYLMATDAAGNVYVVETLNHRIQKFDHDGTYITQWGTLGSTNGQFNTPHGVAVDLSGNVYICDSANNRIQKFTSAGAYITQWGTAGTGNGQFNYPVGVATDGNGYVYVGDYSNSRIQKFTGTGTYVTQWGTSGGGNGQFFNLIGLATDSNGNVYVGDSGNNRIQKFSSTGAYITQWGVAGSGNGQFSSPHGVAVDGADNVYVCDSGNNRVQKFTSAGVYLVQWGAAGTGNGQFNSPLGVTTEPSGNVFVSDRSNNRIEKFGGPRVLLLAPSVSGGVSSKEMVYLVGQGFAVDLSPTNVAWPTTTAGFNVYRAIVIGDPTCGNTDLSLAEGNTALWGPLVNGNVIVIGTDPVFHYLVNGSGGKTLIERGLDYATSQAGRLGLYCCLSCKYNSSPANTAVPVLDGFGVGSFKVQGAQCYNQAHITATHPALNGLTDAILSNWSCSMHNVFSLWPSGFLVLAIGKDIAGGTFQAPDGTEGFPYIIARGDSLQYQQSPCASVDSLVINTGFDQETANVIGSGLPDNEWVVVSDPDANTTEPRPAYVIPKYTAWAAPQTNSTWLSSYPTSDNDRNGHYVFDYHFCLADTLHSSLRVTLRADDTASVYLNGNLLGSTGTLTFSPSRSPVTLTSTSGNQFKAGDNVLRVDVHNTNAVAMGFDLVGAIHGDVPLYHYCCTDSACAIAGRKFEDLDGDGIQDPGEPGLPGWTIHLSNGRTATTDSLGNYYFMSLVPGNYVVNEVQKSGWIQTAPTGGTYTVALARGDVVGSNDFGNKPSPCAADPWMWYQDTFPFNDFKTPGVAAEFDTTTALVKSGLNIAPLTGNSHRFDVPGDSVVIVVPGDQVRVDLVFRILPGPGNYVNPALGVNSQLKAIPTSVTPIPVPVSGIANFWSNYMFNNGLFGTPGGHPTATSGPLAGQKIWNPNVWNSARCDTAELNLFALQGRAIYGGPPSNSTFMTNYHETELADANRGALGIPRNVCFVADTAMSTSTQAVICGSGAVPPGTVYPPAWVSAPGSGFNGQTVKKEGTKILPDGLLTPGSHVEYFFRVSGNSPGAILIPDTTVVRPQPYDGDMDAHRWQEFGVLPDRWKDPAYTHPVLGTTGRGSACMLYVDLDDGHGDEHGWVSVADAIGATRQEKWGAHNGWHAGNESGIDINDPAYRVARHAGQPGTSWDLYSVKASYSPTRRSGSLGSRGGVSALSFSSPSNTQIDGKTSRQGPSQAMLNAYYKIIMMWSGQNHAGVLGPAIDASANDEAILRNFLLTGNTSTPNRGILVGGDGVVESNDNGGGSLPTFNSNFLGVGLNSSSYSDVSGNTAPAVQLQTTTEIDPNGSRYSAGVGCGDTLNVLDLSPSQAVNSAIATYFDPAGSTNAPFTASVAKHFAPTSPWVALTDAWDIDEMGNWNGRSRYFWDVFTKVFAGICDVQGAGPTTTDVPGVAETFRGLLVEGNPARTGNTRLEFTLSVAERVNITIYDISGRRVRTLANRTFPAGLNRLTWDGLDGQGARLQHGAFWARLQSQTGKESVKKIIVLQ